MHRLDDSRLTRGPVGHLMRGVWRLLPVLLVACDESALARDAAVEIDAEETPVDMTVDSPARTAVIGDCAVVMGAPGLTAEVTDTTGYVPTATATLKVGQVARFAYADGGTEHTIVSGPSGAPDGRSVRGSRSVHVHPLRLARELSDPLRSPSRRARTGHHHRRRRVSKARAELLLVYVMACWSSKPAERPQATKVVTTSSNTTCARDAIVETICGSISGPTCAPRADALQSIDTARLFVTKPAAPIGTAFEAEDRATFRDFALDHDDTQRYRNELAGENELSQKQIDGHCCYSKVHAADRGASDCDEAIDSTTHTGGLHPTTAGRNEHRCAWRCSMPARGRARSHAPAVHENDRRSVLLRHALRRLAKTLVIMK